MNNHSNNNPEMTIFSGSNAVAGNTSTSHSINVGSSIVGSIDSSTDEDWYSVELEAGETYKFSLNGSGTSPLGDPLIKLFNSQGVQIEADDDGGPGLNSLLTFTADSNGTFYIAADAYSTSTGQYTLSVLPDSPQILSGSPLSAIDWGTTVTPTGGVINVYFASGGETYDGVTSDGWSAYEITQAMAAFEAFANVINVTFNQVVNPAQSDFQLVTTTNVPYAGYFNPPGTAGAGVGVFATDTIGWNASGGLEQGGFGFYLLLHEFGHAMGLAHPHDTGGSSLIMEGVSNSADIGTLSLNQGVYTTMSYIENWLTSPSGTSQSSSYGSLGSLMALDIASLQADYGANLTTNTGNNIYNLLTGNGLGTYYSSIWDSSGIDTIQHNGSANSTIDLRDANLSYQAGGGGYVSYVDGIQGGFTIANGSIIENATGGFGNDIITGNNFNNIISGRSGNDILDGGLGTDQIFGGAGNDIIYYDAADDLVNVLGGSGIDTLRFENALPINFSLIGNGFEFGQSVQVDTSGNSWDIITNTYNSSWVLDTIETLYDDGSSSVASSYQIATLDTSNSQLWSSYTGFFDANTIRYRENIYNDGGDYLFYYWDINNINPWSEFVDFWDNSGNRYRENIYYDSSDYTFYYWDPTNLQSWSDFREDFDASTGQRSTQRIYNDNGDYSFQFWDVGNANSWDSYFERYDSTGRFEAQYYYDNGNLARTYYDVAGAYSWANYTELYDALGNLISTSGINDDGSLF